jgi:predicted O-methyltransferase YrrM
MTQNTRDQLFAIPSKMEKFMDKLISDFPALTSSNLRNARLFANREDMLAELGQSAKGGKIAEVGVGTGDFSAYILNALAPAEFIGFDTFNLHELEVLWGQSTRELFDGGTHLDYYKNRFREHTQVVKTERGCSHETMVKYPDRYFDLIYIDAGHSYEPVKNDAALASKRLADNGLIIFNDYIMFDHILRCHYGVVPVVNEMIINDGWCVVGFSLQQHMFCDIAIQRK